MNEPDQIGGLEAALTERANKLAAEYLEYARQTREQILADAKMRLHLEEEREVLAAKAHAERIYQQQVQAAELQLHAELDRLRIQLVQSVLDGIPGRLAQLAADEQRYLPLLLEWLREGAQAIERDDLVVQVNRRDWQRLQAGWGDFARQAAPAKMLRLSAETIECSGGVLLVSADNDIRFDNTFEGRLERMSETMQTTINERLSPVAQEAHGR
ncbi:V-type proton ATPase subunit E [Sideroxyarcus emersonii]|uniref:V-type ATP synthase subunit E n=1 Tax=Sideroxyarcus emersonii TaxID=2764705 RepID=A0AAN1XA78_9PROT|nr:V-type ATP synthase subunit E family protein [Sideroxyarcus emersonii]BCK87422.1 V-type proton ATPase subunit E [Sideroxyarcus emersonii]